VAAGEAAAARLIVVDAIDEEAASFYRRFSFTPAPEHALRLYRRMKDDGGSLQAERQLIVSGLARYSGAAVCPRGVRGRGGRRG
jgi:hypothetical protein